MPTNKGQLNVSPRLHLGGDPRAASSSSATTHLTSDASKIPPSPPTPFLPVPFLFSPFCLPSAQPLPMPNFQIPLTAKANMPHSPFRTDNYDILSPIGDGNAGSVYTARHTADTSKSKASLVALKFIPMPKISDSTRREVSIHTTLSHPNIITLHHVLPAIHIPSNTPALALVLEYAPAGDMFTEVSSAGALPARVVRRRLLHIATALSHLHSKNLLHLDVKLENVVLDNAGTAKLVDFGCARYISPNSLNVIPGGTLNYTPPELISEDSACHPNEACDAWSLGVLAYSALAGHYPFHSGAGCEEANTKHRIAHERPRRFPPAVAVPDDLARIVHALLEKDPVKRMTVAQALAALHQTTDTANILRRDASPRRMRSIRPLHNAPKLYRPPSPPRASQSPCPTQCHTCPTCVNHAQRSALRALDFVMQTAVLRDSNAMPNSLRRKSSAASTSACTSDEGDF